MENEGGTCGICLEKVLSSGKINSCSHHFHFKCILRWSKISNHCPTCREAFREIKYYKGTKFVKKVLVRARSNTDDSFSENEYSDGDYGVTCQICGINEREEELIMCDGLEGECDKIYHFSCLGLPEKPRTWLCPECQSMEEEKAGYDSGSVCSSEDFEEEPENEESEELSSSSASEEEQVESESSESSEEEEEEYEEDVVSDPDAEYEPQSDHEEEVLKSRFIETMNSNERRKFIKEFLKPDYSGEDSQEEAWMIFGSMPKKRQRESPNIASVPRKRLRKNNTKENEAAVPQPCSPELKNFVEKLVNTEMDEFLKNAKQDNAINENTIKRRVIKLILDNPRLRSYTDMRTVQKMKALVKNHAVGLFS